jgi:uncharacterized heparinase superfamily protein
MIVRLVRMFHTLRHVRVSQLVARLRLVLRRRWRVRRAHVYRHRMMATPVLIGRIHDSLPPPLFHPRSSLVRLDGDVFFLTFLNETRVFTLPFTWHPPDLAFGTRLWLLNLHYMEFLEALPTDAIVRVVDDWITHVPPYRAGYWMDEWNSYALSIRCVVWMQQFAERRHTLDEPFRRRLTVSLTHQLRFLEDHLEVDIGGNHLVKNIKALLWAGRFFTHEESTRWYRLGERLLCDAIEEQVLPDGMHFERSPAYHSQVMADLLECFSVLQEGAAKEKLRQALVDMAQALVETTHPDGFVSLFNDGGLHMTYAPEECLRVWERLTGRRVSPRPVFALEAAGYFGRRSEEEYLIVDCGAVAPDYLTAHGHGDILAFEWSVGGLRFIVDAGVFEYNAGPARAYSRSTRAHNTLTLDGLDQCEFWGAFRMARRARVRKQRFETAVDGFTLAGSHDGYRRLAGAPEHERTVESSPGTIRIHDRVRGGKGQSAEARLLFHPSCSVIQGTDAVWVTRQQVTVRLLTKASVRVEEGRWFPDFGFDHACRQVVLGYGGAPCEGTFLLEKIH